jgi:hypothetical protein
MVNDSKRQAQKLEQHTSSAQIKQLILDFTFVVDEGHQQ